MRELKEFVFGGLAVLGIAALGVVFNAVVIDDPFNIFPDNEFSRSVSEQECYDTAEDLGQYAEWRNGICYYRYR